MGFLEGESYFSVARNETFRLEFGVGQTITEKPVILEIQHFLMNLPGAYKLYNKKGNPVHFFFERKPKTPTSKPMCRVSIYLSSYITNVLVPFLDSLTWLSKKELDYLDILQTILI